MNRGFFKRRYLVGGLQYRLILANFVYLGSLVALFLAAVYIPLVVTLLDQYVSQPLHEMASRQLAFVHERVWLALPIVVALSVVHSVLISHRIAGPLYRLRRVFAHI